MVHIINITQTEFTIIAPLSLFFVHLVRLFKQLPDLQVVVYVKVHTSSKLTLSSAATTYGIPTNLCRNISIYIS